MNSTLDGLPAVPSVVDGDLTTQIVVDPAEPCRWRVTIVRRGTPLALSDLVPVLEHLGMRVLDERAQVLTGDHGATVLHVHDVRVEVQSGPMPEERIRDVRRILEDVVSGRSADDGFNRLVLGAGLTRVEVEVLRAYARYLLQIRVGLVQAAVEDALSRHPSVARALVEVFAARCRPDDARPFDDLVAGAAAALDGVPSLAEDRIGRALLHLIVATVRTNAESADRRALAFKFDPRLVPDLPPPRPWAEIWVCSPTVEGVHLRGGPIARGGIRWSDRNDFRTEILGLMKAQMVKNAVIVPVGAKGGFVVKRATGIVGDDIGRDELVAAYRDFVGSLLDLTDDVVDGKVVHPLDVVRHDGDDPYLVVAADRGTSDLSDTANEIAVGRGFWLGDAFASGGSAGYDHKEMGITARGAWESVRRHARSLGRDADREPVTTVGIGDMSGDVFGNGMLRSRHLRLVAAFDHRHVFVDPDPDAESSYAERERLFHLPGSSWADYDRRVLSPGGFVVERSVKRVALTEPARRVLGVQSDAAEMTPDDLIRAVLCAPVDLLWNGGIGTYVKASTESNIDAEDRTNDAVRVDACDLRCRIIAEGGNLGVTQRGRVEFARRGGLINTDAIDNSAGVDCSDHEVNIKILLRDAVSSGRLDVADRDDLLAAMTDEVAELVLADNEAQTLGLSLARRRAREFVDVHRRYLDLLEEEGWLDRSLEFLPSDRELADRQAAGEGLSVPEFAVLLAYTKNSDVAEVVQTDLPDDPYLRPELHRYFPMPIRDRFPDLIDRHRLRREIVATSVVNEMVNVNGLTFDHRLTEETGASTADVVRAWVAARDVVDVRHLWARVTEMERDVAPDVVAEVIDELRRMIERSTLWLLRHRRPPIVLADTVQWLRPGVERIGRDLPHLLAPSLAATARSAEASRLVLHVPEDIATASSMWPFLHTAFDAVEIARALERSELDVACAYWHVFDRLAVGWLWDGIGALPRADRWQSQARSALRDDLLATLAELTRDALVCAPDAEPSVAVDHWLAVNERSVTRSRLVQADVARSGTRDLTTLSVGLRQLRNLLVTSPAAHV